jgi:hypothetical protein
MQGLPGVLAGLVALAGCTARNPAYRGAVRSDAPTVDGPAPGDAAVPETTAAEDARANERLGPGDGGATDALDDSQDAVGDVGSADARAAAVGVSRSSFAVGEPIVVTFSGPAGNLDWVGVYRAGEAPSNLDPIVSQVWAYLAAAAGPAVPDVDYDPHAMPPAGIESGTVVLKAGSENPVTAWPLAAGNYDVHLFFDDDHQSRASAPFTVHP